MRSVVNAVSENQNKGTLIHKPTKAENDLFRTCRLPPQTQKGDGKLAVLTAVGEATRRVGTCRFRGSVSGLQRRVPPGAASEPRAPRILPWVLTPVRAPGGWTDRPAPASAPAGRIHVCSTSGLGLQGTPSSSERGFVRGPLSWSEPGRPAVTREAVRRAPQPAGHTVRLQHAAETTPPTARSKRGVTEAFPELGLEKRKKNYK